jgi:hypothetical protein
MSAATVSHLHYQLSRAIDQVEELRQFLAQINDSCWTETQTVALRPDLGDVRELIDQVALLSNSIQELVAATECE